MCINCGCDQPENRHGDQRNITVSDARRAMRTEAHLTGENAGSVRKTGAEMRRMVTRYGGRRRRG
jgi:hypothetical protein